ECWDHFVSLRSKLQSQKILHAARRSTIFGDPNAAAAAAVDGQSASALLTASDEASIAESIETNPFFAVHSDPSRSQPSVPQFLAAPNKIIARLVRKFQYAFFVGRIAHSFRRSLPLSHRSPSRTVWCRQTVQREVNSHTHRVQ